MSATFNCPSGCGRVSECDHITVTGGAVLLHLDIKMPKVDMSRHVYVAARQSSKSSELAQQFNRIMAEIVAASEQRERATRDAWENVRQVVKRSMNATQDDFTLAPQDPRERALWAKEHRNTGPDRATYKHRGIK